MKSYQLFLPAVAALLALSSSQAPAAPPVTFDILATFDYPGASRTYSTGINDRSVVAGWFLNPVDGGHGFLRFPNRFGQPINDPADRHNSTIVTGLNNVGAVCGYYTGSDLTYHSFILSGATYTEIDLGTPNTEIHGINDAGNSCGSTNLWALAFVIIDGTTTTFTIPGADFTVAMGINNLNDCAGWYRIGSDTYGFLRRADGSFVYPILATATPNTTLSGINDNGSMVGTAGDSTGSHAAFFQSLDKHVIYDYPGGDSSTTTYFSGINKRGVISGGYIDATGSHAFIVRARAAAGD